MILKPLRSIFAVSALALAATAFPLSAQAQMTREQAQEEAAKQFRQAESVERIKNNVLAVVADPSKGPEDIKKALEGSSIKYKDSRSDLWEFDAQYIYEARLEVLKDLNTIASPEQAKAIVEVMAKKGSDAIANRVIGGFLGSFFGFIIICLGAAFAVNLLKDRKQNNQPASPPPPVPSVPPSKPSPVKAVAEAPADFDDVVANLQGRQDEQPKGPQP